jgi:hypothetical protein
MPAIGTVISGPASFILNKLVVEAALTLVAQQRSNTWLTAVMTAPSDGSPASRMKSARW